MARNRQTKRIHAALTAFEEATDSLDALDATRRLRVSAEALERDLVKTARKDGRSWAEIGKLYNVTKQGAQQRFRAPRPSDGSTAERPKSTRSARAVTTKREERR